MQALGVWVFLDRLSTKRCCTAALGRTPSLEHWSTIVQPSSRMSLLSPLLELSISSRMYRHFSRFDSFGWHFTVKVPPQQIILAQCVFLWDQSCSLMIQVRYFFGIFRKTNKKILTWRYLGGWGLTIDHAHYTCKKTRNKSLKRT